MSYVRKISTLSDYGAVTVRRKIMILSEIERYFIQLSFKTNPVSLPLAVTEILAIKKNVRNARSHVLIFHEKNISPRDMIFFSN